jgi:hypothetical protein
LAAKTSLVAAKILIGGRKTAERDLLMAQTWKRGMADPPEGNSKHVAQKWNRSEAGKTMSARNDLATRNGSQKNELDSSPDLAGEEDSRMKNSDRAVVNTKWSHEIQKMNFSLQSKA